MSKPTLTKSGFRLRAVALAASCGVFLVGCGGGSVTNTPMDNNEPTPAELAAQRRAMQQKAELEAAHMALTAALVPTLNTEEEFETANAAHTRLTAVITAADDVSAADLAKYETAASSARDRIDDAKKIFDEEQARLRAMQQAEEQRKAREEAARMAALAAKLHAGIYAPTEDGTGGTPAAADIRFAGYSSTGDAIHVQNGVAIADAKALSEDEDTPVAALHGWAGKRYHRMMPNEGTYEAHVYSHVGEPTMGAKFNAGAVALPEVGDLDGTSGETGILSSLTGYEALVASDRFDQGAGTKEFEKPVNAERVMFSGTYYGVPGDYYCMPDSDSTCAARKAAKGFKLGNTLDSDNTFTEGGWTFKPSNPEARVMSTPDAVYASYGWWLHKSQDDRTYTASAFVDTKGTVDPATGLGALNGTATYSGGAVGKYALSSSTGGTNDAGHFTAEATLEANFTTDKITGTVHNFMGADGMSRDWSVELMESAIGDTGLIRRSDDDNSDLAATDPGAMTKWTIGGTAASASGEWSGTLYEPGADTVPAIATGTFYTEYGSSGKMVGAFGVNKQE